MIATYHTIYNNICRTAHTGDLQVFCGEVYIAIDSQCFTIGALPEVQADAHSCGSPGEYRAKDGDSPSQFGLPDHDECVREVVIPAALLGLLGLLRLFFFHHNHPFYRVGPCGKPRRHTARFG